MRRVAALDATMAQRPFSSTRMSGTSRFTGLSRRWWRTGQSVVHLDTSVVPLFQTFSVARVPSPSGPPSVFGHHPATAGHLDYSVLRIARCGVRGEQEQRGLPARPA